MADTTINPPSSSLKLYYRVARFAWQNGEQYLGFTSDLYFRPPSSHIFETCENFLCWETEWIALPAHRSKVEAASISILSNGELCSGAVAANERSESATPLSSSHSTSNLHPHSTLHTYVTEAESATGPIYYTQQMLEELDYAAWVSECVVSYMADCAVAEVLARIETALERAGSYSWIYFYWDDRLTISAFQYNEVASGTTDDYGDVINLPRNAYLQHFTYTH